MVKDIYVYKCERCTTLTCVGRYSNVSKSDDIVIELRNDDGGKSYLAGKDIILRFTDDTTRNAANYYILIERNRS